MNALIGVESRVAGTGYAVNVLLLLSRGLVARVEVHFRPLFSIVQDTLFIISGQSSF